MLKQDIFSQEFKNSCKAFIKYKKLTKKIIKHGMSIDDFIDHIISNAFLVVKKDSDFKIGTITGNLILWELYKLKEQEIDNLRYDLNKLENKKRTESLELEDFKLSWQEQMLLCKMKDGKTIKEIAKEINEPYHIVRDFKKRMMKKIKKQS